MNLPKPILVFLSLAAAIPAWSQQAVTSEGVTSDLLLHPPPDTWPGYHGGYPGKRHTALNQITSENVKHLGLAWLFQTGEGATLKMSPLLVDGVIYITTPDNIYAIDARSGHQIWHYRYPPNKGFHIGERGVGMYKNWLYSLTPDAHLLCLNAHDGTVRWNIVVADSHKGYWTTMAPFIIRNHVIVGISGDFDNLRAICDRLIPRPVRRNGLGTARRLRAHRKQPPAA